MDTASASTTAHLVEAFRRGLSVVGYDEGRNVAIEYRWSEGDYDKLPALAAELVRHQVAVIATINTPTILAAKAATQIIPIVFGVGVDPIKFGLVTSLNRPGDNLTGVTQLNIEMEAKRVQLLVDIVNEINESINRLQINNPNISSTDIQNVLIAAYCRVVAESTGLAASEKLRRIRQFDKVLEQQIAANTMPPGTLIIASVPLPPAVYRQLRSQAADSHQTPAQLMATILARAAGR
jgi:hypothetical protein